MRTTRREALDFLRTTRSRSIVAGDEVWVFVFLFKTRDSIPDQAVIDDRVTMQSGNETEFATGTVRRHVGSW